MNRRLVIALTLIGIMALASVAHAQATRTWVSGVGDDANPCSRTAPCKTFAGAISKTASAGEISVLDPGGFGAVTITKSITLNGTGQIAGVLNASVNGVVINAAGISVVLRNIDINGAGSGLDGVKIFAARAVSIEGVHISGQRGAPGRGVDIVTSTACDVYIDHSLFVDFAGHGVANLPSAGSPVVRLTVNDSTIKDSGGGNGDGFFLNVGTVAAIERTVVSGFTGAAVEANNAIVVASNNTFNADVRGVLATGTGNVFIARNVISNNTTSGFNANSGGVISTFGDNYFANNGADVGVLTSVAANKK